MKYVFLDITSFCSSYIREEEVNNLEPVVSVLLLRKVTIHIQIRLWNLVFVRIRKRFWLWLWEWAEAIKEVAMNWKRKLSACVRERKKLTALKLLQSFLRYIRNVNLLFKKDFKRRKRLTKTSSFFLYIRHCLANREWSKRWRRKYMGKSN